MTLVRCRLFLPVLLFGATKDVCGKTRGIRTNESPLRERMNGRHLRSREASDLEYGDTGKVLSMYRELEDYEYTSAAGKGKKSKNDHAEGLDDTEYTGSLSDSPSTAPSPSIFDEGSSSDPIQLPTSPPTPSSTFQPTPVVGVIPPTQTNPDSNLTPPPQQEASDGDVVDTPATTFPPTGQPLPSEPTFLPVEDPSCVAAQSGQVFTTPVNTTIYYQYELLTTRTADLTNSVWPSVDEAFQKFLALKLVDCGLGSSSTIQGVSPEPADSIGTWYLDGRDSSCTGITGFDDEELFCDVVTGSVTIYLSPTLYLSNDNGAEATTEAASYLELRNQVLSTLWEEINVNRMGPSRRRQLQGPSSLVDSSKGIYDLYFLSKPIDLAPPPAGAQGSGDSSASSKDVESTDSRTGNAAVAASLAAVTLLVMGAVGFAIHRRNTKLDSDSESFKQVKTDMYMSECSSPDIGTHEDDSRYEVSALGHRDRPTGTRDIFQSSEFDDISEVPTYDFAKISCHEGNEASYSDGDESASFTFSQVGRSMRLTSPDGTVRTGNNMLSRMPSVTTDQSDAEETPELTDEPGWRADFKRRGEFESRGKVAVALTETPTAKDSPGFYHRDDDSDDDKEWTTKVIKTSAPTSVILAVANEVLGDVEEGNSYAEESTFTASTAIGSGVKSLSDSLGFSSAKSPHSELYIVTPGTLASKPSGDSEEEVYHSVTPSPGFPGSTKTPLKTPRHLSVAAPSTGSTITSEAAERRSLSYSSPDSLMNWGFFKTASPFSSSPKVDSPDSVEASTIDAGSTSVSASPTLSDEGSCRTEYLKSRRRELEGRFQEYKQKLSANLVTLNVSTTSAIVSHESSRSLSVYKNDESNSSAGSGAALSRTPIFSPYGSEQRGRRNNISSETSKSVPQSLQTPTSSEKNQSRRRSRTPTNPRIRRHYTSLNDIEDILDLDQEWKVPDDEGEGGTDRENLDAFLFSRPYASVEHSVYPQFQADTVQL